MNLALYVLSPGYILNKSVVCEWRMPPASSPMIAQRCCAVDLRLQALISTESEITNHSDSFSIDLKGEIVTIQSSYTNTSRRRQSSKHATSQMVPSWCLHFSGFVPQLYSPDSYCKRKMLHYTRNLIIIPNLFGFVCLFVHVCAYMNVPGFKDVGQRTTCMGMF